MDTEQREGIVMLVKAIIGAAALVFPRCFQRAGIIPATIALIIAGWAGIIVGDLLMETRRALGPKVSTFRDMGVAATGSRWGGILLDATVTLQSFGTLCGYVIAVGDLVSSSLHKDWNVPELIQVPSFIANMIFSSSDDKNIHVITVRSFSLIFLTVFVFFPLCLLKKLESLRSLAASTMFIYCFFLLVLLKECATRVALGDFHMGEMGERKVMPSAPLNWMNGGLNNLFRVLPIIALSYSCVPLMFEVRRTLERRLPSRSQVESSWKVVAIASFAASGFFYIATGFLGYVAFRGSTSANVLTNLEDLGWIASMVNALFAASLVVSYPLICFVVREPVRRVLFWSVSFVTREGDDEESSKNELDVEQRPVMSNAGGNGNNNVNNLSELNQSKDSLSRNPIDSSPPLAIFVLEAAIVTSATLAAAIAFPGIDVILELIGGTAAVFVSYVAPVGLFYLVKPESFQKDRIKAFVIGLVGTWIGILTCWNLWVSLRTPQNIPVQIPKN